VKKTKAKLEGFITMHATAASVSASGVVSYVANKVLKTDKKQN
jgi:hypothetical protein